MASSLTSSTQVTSLLHCLLSTVSMFSEAADNGELSNRDKADQFYRISGVVLINLGLIAVAYDKPIVATSLSLPGLSMLALGLPKLPNEQAEAFHGLFQILTTQTRPSPV